MEAVRLFDIHFTEYGEREGFFEGQEVEGVVNLELMEDLVIDHLEIEFTGTARIQISKDLVDKKSKSKSRKKSKKNTSDISNVVTCDEKYLNQRLTLYSRSNDSLNFIVPAGQHAYRFRVQLPYNLPSSVVADRGSIRYYATATLNRPWHPKEQTSKEFRVRTLVDLNQLNVRPVTSEMEETQSVLCFVVGSIQATWHLERVAYVPGESVAIQGHIDNRSRVKVKKSKASLVQHIRYYDLTDARYLHERRMLGSAERGEVAPGTTSSWCEAIRIPELVPPGGLKGCTLMEINYALKMKVVPAGPLHNMETTTEIIIGSVGRGANVAGHQLSTSQQQGILSPHHQLLLPPHYRHSPLPASPHTIPSPDTDLDSESALELNYFV